MPFERTLTRFERNSGLHLEGSQMGKAMGATVFLLATGTVTSSWLTSTLGTLGEAAAVGVMGLGMLAVSQLLGAKLPQGTSQPVNQT